MKKIFLYVITLFAMLTIMPFSSYAETLPVKKVEFIDKDSIIILRENGDLLLGHSIDTEIPEVLAKNTIDYKYRTRNSIKTEVMALHDNGDITKISISNYGQTNEKITKETLKVNAEKIYDIGGSLGFLTSNHELQYVCNTGVFSSDVTIENIKKVCCSQNSWGPIYAISFDDTLYSYKINYNEEIEKNEILTDVSDCILANGNDILVLRNNHDLYFIKQGKTPERIGTNIESIEKVAFENTWTDGYTIDYVNKNGEYYSGSTQKSYTKYLDNVKNVRMVGSHKYVITNDNVIYSSSNQYVGLANPRKVENRIDILGFSYQSSYAPFYVDTNGTLYDNHQNIYMQDIKDVIFYDPLGNDEDRYLYLKKNGELWGAFGNNPKEVFITSFCQKPTIVEINKKEIKLTAKIQMVNNRSMYPFRECLESMGATVLWDSVNKVAIGEYNGNTIEFPIDSNKYYVNGTIHEMDTRSYVDNSIGRTYIPIRYAAEGLGFNVDWIEGDTENTIKIYK